MMEQLMQLLGVSDLSMVSPELQVCLSSLMLIWILSEVFGLLRIVLYRIFGGDH